MDARARRLPSLADGELPRTIQEGEIALSERLRGLEREVAVDPIKSSNVTWPASARPAPLPWLLKGRAG